MGTNEGPPPGAAVLVVLVVVELGVDVGLLVVEVCVLGVVTVGELDVTGLVVVLVVVLVTPLHDPKAGWLDECKYL